MIKTDVINFIKSITDSLCVAEIKTNTTQGNAIFDSCKLTYDEKGNRITIANHDGKIKFYKLEEVYEFGLGIDEKQKLKLAKLVFGLEITIGIATRIDNTLTEIRKPPLKLYSELEEKTHENTKFTNGKKVMMSGNFISV